jgi:integrase
MAKLRPRYRTAADRAAGRVSGFAAVFYDPTRAPAEKVVTLRTTNEAVARRKLAEMERRESLGLFDPWGDAAPEAGVTVGDAAKRYKRSQERAGRSPNTVATAERLLSLFENQLPAGTLINHVERRHVERFLNAPKKDKEGKPKGERSAATKKRYHAVLSHFLGWAKRKGLRPDNPAADVETAPLRTNRRDHLTEAEEAAVLRAIAAKEVLDGHSRRWLSDWIAFGCRTGLRPGEQQALRWSAVNLAEGVVHVGRGHRTKTAGSARTVPIRGAALDVLRRRASERVGEADGQVFTGTNGGMVEMRYLSKQLVSFTEEANVPKRVTAYCLRHSAGTRLALAGVPLFIIARILGTSVAMVERHYAAYAPDAGALHLERVFGSALVATSA